MTSETAPAIWWIRRDMRLHENPVLASIHASGRSVIPVFIVDPRLMAAQSGAAKRIVFMFDSLRALRSDIADLGGVLRVIEGPPEAVFPEVMAESGATEVVAQRDYSAIARRRDAKVGARVPLEMVEGLCAREPGEVRKPDGTAYARFTSYFAAWRRGIDDLGISSFDARSTRFVSGGRSGGLSYPSQVPDARFIAGEDAGKERLEEFFTARSQRYEQDRDLLDGSGSSGLSPYLRFGSISARAVAERAIASGAESWLRELAWRDYYFERLARDGDCSDPGLDPVRWLPARDDLVAWCDGMTGYPVVDAAMRQLSAEGWISNRLRMIAASFLTKHLLVDWREGERHFMKHLIDGDVASNRGGWRWVAGVGSDASPFFRIFNPVSQAKKFDPAGSYVKRWVPELRSLPSDQVHEPWLALARPCGYPPPIVDHPFARARALDAFKEMRRQTR